MPIFKTIIPLFKTNIKKLLVYNKAHEISLEVYGNRLWLFYEIDKNNFDNHNAELLKISYDKCVYYERPVGYDIKLIFSHLEVIHSCDEFIFDRFATVVQREDNLNKFVRKITEKILLYIKD